MIDFMKSILKLIEVEIRQPVQLKIVIDVRQGFVGIALMVPQGVVQIEEQMLIWPGQTIKCLPWILWIASSRLDSST